MLRGGVEAGGRSIETYQTALFNNDGGNIELTANGTQTELLLLAGKPIGEPVAMGGPFVMNTQAEIAQAEADYAAGLFDNVTLAETA